jgi:ferritin-like metal-binding protein YciE
MVDTAAMTLGSLNPALVEELKDAYDAEKQLLRALPKMRKAGFSEELSEAFMLHTGQREEHVERLKSVFEVLTPNRSVKRCQGVKGIVAEAEALLAEEPKADPPVLEAASIAAAQRAEHYEIARFVSREKGLAKRGVCESYRALTFAYVLSPSRNSVPAKFHRTADRCAHGTNDSSREGQPLPCRFKVCRCRDPPAWDSRVLDVGWTPWRAP